MKRRDFLEKNTRLLALATLAGLAPDAGRGSAGRESRTVIQSPYKVNAGSDGWWEKEPLLIYEVIMFTMPGHSVDSNWQQDADPAVEAGDVAAAHALQTHQTSIITGHLTNRFCYFRSPHFKENRRDYLAAYLEKSRAAGFRTIVYFNVHAVKPEFGAERPEWRQVKFDGRTLDDVYGVETSFCVNSPWRDWVRGVCLDLCKYPIDGIFFDGPCLFANCCYCAHCRKLYREAHGREMPPKEPGKPETAVLARFQAESLRRFLEHSNRAVKSVRPDVLLYCNAGPREEPSYLIGRNNRALIQSQDVLGAEGGFSFDELSGQPAWRVGSNAKYYQTQASGKPTVVYVSAAHYPWVSANQTDAELELAFSQAPVHGSGVWFFGFPWFRERPGFQRIAANYKFFADHRDVYFGTRSLARAAVVWPADALNFYKGPADSEEARRGREPVGSVNDEFNGIYDALIKAHVPCDILDEESLRREDIGRYSLLIFPNAACTGKEADDKLRDFVRGGGNVVASYETSLFDASGGGRADFGLADLFGVRLLRSGVRPYPHFYLFRREEWPQAFGGISQHLLPAPKVSCEIRLDGATLISPFSVKFKGWDGSEILPSEFPAVTVNRFGEGRAVYLAAPFGEHYWKYKQPEIRILLANLFRWLSPPAIEIENAPETVEVVHRQTADGREVITLLNYSGGLTRPFEAIRPVEGLTIRVKTFRARARALKAADIVEQRRDGDELIVRLARLEIFETLVLE